MAWPTPPSCALRRRLSPRRAVAAPYQPLPNPRQKHVPIHGAVKQPRGAGPRQADRRNEGAGLIVSMRDGRDESLVGRCSVAPAGHFAVGPTFIHEHQPGRAVYGKPLMPMHPLFDHVGAVLLGGVQRFFYRSTPACAATHPPSKSQTDGPGAHPTRPASHRAARPPVVAGGPCAWRLTASCARTNGFVAGGCRVA